MCSTRCFASKNILHFSSSASLLVAFLLQACVCVCVCSCKLTHALQREITPRLPPSCTVGSPLQYHAVSALMDRSHLSQRLTSTREHIQERKHAHTQTHKMWQNSPGEMMQKKFLNSSIQTSARRRLFLLMICPVPPGNVQGVAFLKT